VRSAAIAIEAASRFRGSADTLDEVLRLFLGWEQADPLPEAEDLPNNGAALPDVVVSRSQASSVSKQLARQGYTRQHRFAILPSRTQPRWLLPLTDARRAIDGFELYTPYSRATRLMKALVVRVRETNQDSPSSSERKGNSPLPNPSRPLRSHLLGPVVKAILGDDQPPAL